jgi:hypothetical protein
MTSEHCTALRRALDRATEVTAATGGRDFHLADPKAPAESIAAT